MNKEIYNLSSSVINKLDLLNPLNIIIFENKLENVYYNTTNPQDSNIIIREYVDLVYEDIEIKNFTADEIVDLINEKIVNHFNEVNELKNKFHFFIKEKSNSTILDFKQEFFDGVKSVTNPFHRTTIFMNKKIASYLFGFFDIFDKNVNVSQILDFDKRKYNVVVSDLITNPFIFSLLPDRFHTSERICIFLKLPTSTSPKHLTMSIMNVGDPTPSFWSINFK